MVKISVKDVQRSPVSNIVEEKLPLASSEGVEDLPASVFFYSSCSFGKGLPGPKNEKGLVRHKQFQKGQILKDEKRPNFLQNVLQ